MNNEAIEKLQHWYAKHCMGTLSKEEAKKVLALTNFWGYSIFDAAYDILMGDEPK